MRLFLALLCLALAVGCSSTAPISGGQITVSISGEVKNGGTYFIPQGSSLAEAVQRAGGFTAWPWLKDIEIVHRDGSVGRCDYRKIGDRFILADGDKIEVHRYM
jgi:protein involved in polysaccharide export with SLBB domain